MGHSIQKTDTHFRSQDGIGNFNWRMVFDVEIEEEPKNQILQFKIYDKDLFSSDDFISSGQVDFTALAKIAFDNEITMKMYDEDPKEPVDIRRFDWVNCRWDCEPFDKGGGEEFL